MGDTTGTALPIQQAEALLRAPFAPAQIGKLPRTTCKDCSNAQGRVCSDHKKARCAACGNYMTTAHIDLDFVGHAIVTARLLDVDPDWTWEPMALDEHGAPALDREGNLWIRLTILEVTRPGVGDGSSMKERIGDAIRNAAMRFGVALDLWAKQDLHAPEEDERQVDAPKDGPVSEEWVASFAIATREAGMTDEERHAVVRFVTGGTRESSKELLKSETGAVRWTMNALTGEEPTHRFVDDEEGGPVKIVVITQEPANA